MGRFLLQDKFRYKGISIHPSRVGWDASLTKIFADDGAFQSTHPVWDGT